MKDLCESERPRERMLSLGADSLGTGELLAILLRNGNSRESALELAQRLLGYCSGNLQELFNMSMEQLQDFPGIGPCKAASVAAAFELGKRFLQTRSTAGEKPLASARMVYDLMIPLLKGLDHEECWVVWLNSRNCATGRAKINTGCGTSTVIDLKRITRLSLEKKAAGVFLIHNHPGGDPRPSIADIQQTTALKESLHAIDVKLVDHVIVADNCFYSFAAEETMKSIN